MPKLETNYLKKQTTLIGKSSQSTRGGLNIKKSTFAFVFITEKHKHVVIFSGQETLFHVVLIGVRCFGSDLAQLPAAWGSAA